MNHPSERRDTSSNQRMKGDEPDLKLPASQLVNATVPVPTN